MIKKNFENILIGTLVIICFPIFVIASVAVMSAGSCMKNGVYTGHG